MKIFTILLSIVGALGLRYDLNEILRCHITYADDPTQMRWCIIAKHYEQMFRTCPEFDED